MIADYSFAVKVIKEILLACIFMIVVFIQFGSERQKTKCAKQQIEDKILYNMNEKGRRQI